MQIIEQFQKCHVEHPVAKFFGECTDLKIKLDRCFREEVSFPVFFSFSIFIVSFKGPFARVFLWSVMIVHVLQQKALKRKANFERSKKFKEQLRDFRKENAASSSQ